MAVSEEDIQFATDLFLGLGPLTTRKMMGGLCLYSEGTIFAIVHSDFGVMIKGDGAFKDELDAMGLTRWTYQRDGAAKPTAMPYWKLPDSALDDPEEACDLARRALAFL
ncbi:TfoX/Sxy family protein [Octadecabacter sp. 1_MG-2023]|uniref:TfoX/Sxy family protein n=1 Tax=unclassified Octadecabacter TaxID=196158 RepID=UPI001C0A344E|nr:MULTISPECIES: TfoX/Sxy family protein [unclassified Octadecabacter]MBU2993528.1 TfoX/Sxy family protein [Octadecabacter sp. B2R22]MDO6735628.1 TfoX/Sxy family protein [Octadecabacter sp. 1_MG-2023]